MLGTWSDPYFDENDDTASRRSFQLARGAFFNLMIEATGSTNPESGPPYASHGTHHLQIAREEGLNCLVGDNHFNGAFSYVAPAFDSTDAAEVLANWASLSSAENDGLVGYDMSDEPSFRPSNATWLKSWVAAMHQNDIDRDDGHERAAYINFQWGVDTGTGYYSDWNDAVSDFVTDSDTLKRIDVVSASMFAFNSGTTESPGYTSQYFYRLKSLKTLMGERPFWAVSYITDFASNMPTPDENHIRYKAFCPAAAGAKGIIWFIYRNVDNVCGYNCGDEMVVHADAMQTERYRWIKTVNHYLHDVVGPVTMKCDHLGLFHESSSPSSESGLDLVDGSTPAVSDLGNDNLAVGIFQPPGTTSEYYLLVVNKTVSPQSATVTLQDTYAIAEGPAAVGYVGGNAYMPLGTGTTFDVSLAGGEGRMYHLTEDTAPNVVLTAPSGGDTWLPGESRTVTWQSDGQPVDLTLYPSNLEDGPEIDGPGVSLGTGLTGGSASITMPYVVGSRTWLVATSTGTDSVVRHATTPQPISTVSEATSEATYYDISSGTAAGEVAMALGPSGLPGVMYTVEPTPGRPNLWYTSFNGSTWQTPDSLLLSNSCLVPDVTIDANGDVHAVIVEGTLFNRLFIDATLRYAHRSASGTWSSTDLANALGVSILGDVSGTPAIAAASDSEVYIAYNNGRFEDRDLAVIKYDGSSWAEFGPQGGLSNPTGMDLVPDGSGGVYVALLNRVSTYSVARVHHVTSTGFPTLMFLWGNYSSIALARGSNDSLYVAAVKVVDAAAHQAELVYRAGTGNSWGPAVTVDNSVQTIDDVSIALQNGVPRITYVSNGAVKFAARNDSTWVLGIVDQFAVAGGQTEMAFNDSSDRWVSYFDKSARTVRLAGPYTGSGGGSGGGCPICSPCDPCFILPALTLRVANTIVHGNLISYSLETNGDGEVKLSLFDVMGRQVASRAPERVTAGKRSVQWRVGSLNPGLYFLKATHSGGPADVRRVIMIR